MKSEITNLNVSSNPSGDTPQIDKSAYVDPTARIIGNVHIGPGCYIASYAVIRADEADEDGNVAPVCIGEDSNIQDGVVIHALTGTKVQIAKRCSIAHGAIVHGPSTLADDCFVGFRAVVYNSVLKSGVFVGTSAVVQGVNLSEGDCVTPNATVLSNEDVVKSVSKTSADNRAFMEKVITANRLLVKSYNSK